MTSGNYISKEKRRVRVPIFLPSLDGNFQWQVEQSVSSIAVVLNAPMLSKHHIFLCVFAFAWKSWRETLKMLLNATETVLLPLFLSQVWKVLEDIQASMKLTLKLTVWGEESFTDTESEVIHEGFTSLWNTYLVTEYTYWREEKTTDALGQFHQAFVFQLLTSPFRKKAMDIF